MGGDQNLSEIAWRHLWDDPYYKFKHVSSKISSADESNEVDDQEVKELGQEGDVLPHHRHGVNRFPYPVGLTLIAMFQKVRPCHMRLLILPNFGQFLSEVSGIKRRN